MAEHPGPIYQLRLVASRESAETIDAWLGAFVRESLRQPGVLDCHSFPFVVGDAAQLGRVCQFSLASDAALDEFEDQVVATAEAELASRFGSVASISSHILREDLASESPAGVPTNCLNCGTHLRGQYCGQCGQRSRSRLISLWELISDAFGDLFELDSRLWQTLLPLVAKPGQLTRDYLQGRRARFMPPFRMYLVLSLVFFVVAFFNPREELSLFFEEPGTAQDPPPDVGTQDADGQPVEKDGVVISLGDSDDTAEGDDDGDEGCNLDASDLDEFPGWLARRMTPERICQVYDKISADDGKSLGEKVVANAPTALIVLLPLMALVLKALYPLSRRYYVEHLLFLVHLHAFLFLLLTLQILFLRFTGLIAVPELAVTLMMIASVIYIPVYLFIAMRRVYGQSRFMTFLKYIVLLFAYIAGFTTVMSLTFALAAFSI